MRCPRCGSDLYEVVGEDRYMCLGQAVVGQQPPGIAPNFTPNYQPVFGPCRTVFDRASGEAARQQFELQAQRRADEESRRQAAWTAEQHDREERANEIRRAIEQHRADAFARLCLTVQLLLVQTSAKMLPPPCDDPHDHAPEFYGPGWRYNHTEDSLIAWTPQDIAAGYADSVPLGTALDGTHTWKGRFKRSKAGWHFPSGSTECISVDDRGNRSYYDAWIFPDGSYACRNYAAPTPKGSEAGWTEYGNFRPLTVASMADRLGLRG